MASNRRVDIRKILADPDLRRKLMVSTIQATQAREGIETTKEQADRAYYVVTEGERAAFFKLRQSGNRTAEYEHRHRDFVSNIWPKDSSGERIRYDVTRRDFTSLEGSPLIYAQIALIGPIFRENPCLDPVWGYSRGGMNSTESNRFVRFRWEPSFDTRNEWVSYSKGGSYSRFYSDLDLVINWTDNGHELRTIVKQKYGSESRFIKSPEFYFRRGLTWTEKSSLGLSVRILEEGAVFNVSGPAAFPKNTENEWYLLGVLNSTLIAYVAWALSGRNYGASYIASIPIAEPSSAAKSNIETIGRSIYQSKASWDSGNEISTHFIKPWLLREDIIDPTTPNTKRLDQLAEFEAAENVRIQTIYNELNDEVYRLYGIPEGTRKVIEETLGNRPPEIIWPQMEGKTTEQKRMEHVWRLLSYMMKRVVEADTDGIVPFDTSLKDVGLMDRVYHEIEDLFSGQPVSRVEVDIVNELKKRVKGYRSVNSIREWLEDVFFSYHATLYKKRPVIWHIASRQGKGQPAFGALVHYHRFDRNGMALLRGTYLREAMESFKREAALASRENREEDRMEWQAGLEEAQDLDRRLQLVQEGRHEGPKGGDRDFRILTPWKPADKRPKGWDPDLDDGVKVNIEPLQKAGILRIKKVI